MDVELQPGTLRGSINIPSSKSLCHRAIIAAGLSKGRSHIENILFSKDIEASIDGMVSLGAKIISEGDKLFIEAPQGIQSQRPTRALIWNDRF